MKLIIHGGFFSESLTDPETKFEKQNALIKIVQKGYDYLSTHTAAQTAVYTVSLLEDDPLFNAGLGSQIQSDGIIRMSAALMDGKTLRMSGVINIENIQHPIQVAEKLMSYDDRILGDKGAITFAHKNDFANFNPEIEQRRKEFIEQLYSTHTSTVGCVCLDANKNIAVATSTGGKGFEIPGRISDSATVAGNYANQYCGVSMTGVGEDIVSGAMAAKIVTRVTDEMSIKDAFHKSFEELKQIEGFAGAIGIDYLGNIFHQESHPTMVFASFDGVELNYFQ
ncbi:isoaspartyl peptidase/L-asparaginase [Empedobacter falsenii]|uniref:isoaspartyl peptidase/L-asparaginase n=1 Tax=Empedobacter falsenii TaxID=343874 RepID=UPI0025766446|nr:isoaspartyl peptidase/L-asparaginase [Empedobacter falsenii]MDM1297298.1 isoaspartyl peptidase/L-asparaginase [Empedobacter falsenii]MDM1317092.1 isoaspartyl peptidase/L-asparaginase [Empedobacter falsenii]